MKAKRLEPTVLGGNDCSVALGGILTPCIYLEPFIQAERLLFLCFNSVAVAAARVRAVIMSVIDGLSGIIVIWCCEC